MSPALRSGLLGLVTALSLATGGCGADEPDSAGSAPTTAAPTQSSAPEPDAGEQTEEQPEPQKKPEAPTGSVIDITFAGDTVTPSGVARKAEAGEPVTLHIVADAPGELHVHSSPEQEIEYPAGTSDHELVIKQPGLVEVEAHDLGRLVVRLEVR